MDLVSGATKRVFFGQRWLSVIQQHPQAETYVTAWHTEEEARAHVDRIHASYVADVERWEEMNKNRERWCGLSAEPPHGRPDVEYVIEAKVKRG